jgi:MFS family permease
MLVNALPLIAEELNLSQSKQARVVDAYALPFAALLMIAGALGDRYGRRGGVGIRDSRGASRALTIETA